MTQLQACHTSSLSLTHSLIGGKWKVRIIWNIINGCNRFSTLRRAIPEITEKVLYTNLRELENSGLIYKETDVIQQPPAVSYYVREEHKDLITVIEAINVFTDNYVKHNNTY